MSRHGQDVGAHGEPRYAPGYGHASAHAYGHQDAHSVRSAGVFSEGTYDVGPRADAHPAQSTRSGFSEATYDMDPAMQPQPGSRHSGGPPGGYGAYDDVPSGVQSGRVDADVVASDTFMGDHAVYAPNDPKARAAEFRFKAKGGRSSSQRPPEPAYNQRVDEAQNRLKYFDQMQEFASL